MESKGGRMSKMRIVVLGSGAVGKSSLIVRLTTGQFFEDYDPTIEDCHMGGLSVDGQPVRLEILDTAGQGDFHSSFLDQWIESAQGVLMVYSIDNPHSLEELHDIRDRILLSKDDEKFPIVLVGNKSDIGSKRMVTKSPYICDRFPFTLFLKSMNPTAITHAFLHRLTLRRAAVWRRSGDAPFGKRQRRME
mmetsp:Transcript_18680/g.29694  ORF Transcript_18680/g.29694 Transcript_18680/m.29694 type:complete len:191 (-) Transcript_18680:171-743(-)